MQLDILKNEEKQMNLLMFLVWGFLIPIVAFSFVMLFLGGTIEEASVLSMVVLAIVIRIFERKLGTKAKYLYACLMPICGALTMVVGNDGRFGAMTQAYFLTTVMVIAYYDVSVVIVNAVVTIVVNLAAMIIFPGAYLKLHSLIVWIFIFMVYALCAITALLISSRTYKLFMDIEKKEDKVEGILVKVSNITERLGEASVALVETSQTESVSTEELSSISENLLESNELMLNKAEQRKSCKSGGKQSAYGSEDEGRRLDFQGISRYFNFK